MDVTLITRNVITLDNLMQMSPLLSEQGGKKKSSECVFSVFEKLSSQGESRTSRSGDVPSCTGLSV